MNRRSALKACGTAAIGISLGGCRTARPPQSVAPPTRPPLVLPPVLASWDRIIRTTVGLRPHRPSGFNISAQPMDGKTVIHNYGHGGAGHSLGWGCGILVAELALSHADRRAAVLGCGTVGLTTARQLQRRGFDVTIYAKAVPPDTTSNMSLAAFTPTSGLLGAESTPEWQAQFRSAVAATYRELQLLAGRDYGISWLDSFAATDNVGAARPVDPQRPPTNFNGLEMGGLMPPGVSESAGRVVLGPGEHPFPTQYAIWQRQIRIEPSIYLDALMRDFRLFGGRIVIRTFDTPRDLMSLDENLIVNCTGLGSATLFSDTTMVPVKGQLTVLIPQPEVNYACRVMPRRDGIAIGTTQERGVSTLEPNEEAMKRNVDAVIKFYSGMRPASVSMSARLLDMPRDTPSVESFFGLES
jgi:glycine/D-amino acid oxidase-like deaminating enzyme